MSANEQIGFLVPMAQSTTPSSKRDEDASGQDMVLQGHWAMDDVNGAQSSVMVPKPQALFTVPGRHPLLRLQGTPNPGKGFGSTLLLGLTSRGSWVGTP